MKPCGLTTLSAGAIPTLSVVRPHGFMSGKTFYKAPPNPRRPDYFGVP
jgi:hypothetical protein